MRKNRGRLIALEGIDQAGKRTQAALLARKLSRGGYVTSIWSFPDYKTPLGKQLKVYLAGRRKLDYHSVHLLYAANKWEQASKLENAIRDGSNIIVNRYSPSNIAYGVAHGLPLAWLNSLEDGLPKPDAVFVLDINPSISFKRKSRRRDVHERDLKYLKKVRSAYLRLARKYGWRVVDANKSLDNVHSELWTGVSGLLKIKLANP